MALKYADATAEWTVPLSTKRSYLRADATFARPGDGYSYLDGRGGWTGPQMGVPADSLPVGTPGDDTLVEFLSIWDEPIVWRVIGRDLPGMPSNSVTLLADKIIVWLPFDGSEPGNSNDRGYGGNNDWVLSNLRQWLNSSRGAGVWYSAQHSLDQPPDDAHVYLGDDDYQKLAGFLNGAPSKETRALISTSRKIGGFSGNATSCSDKIFLLTSNEIGLETLDGNGTKIEYFADNASRIAYPTSACIAHLERPFASNLSNPRPYFTATSRADSGTSPRYVASDGTSNYGTAGCYAGSGVRPACNIRSSTKFSREPNDAGHYTLV